MKITLKELAKKLDVSPATVSKALNGYDDIGAETKKKVLAAADKFNYRPNAIGRSLARKKTDTIGLFLLGEVEAVGHPFAMELISGIMNISRKNNYDILLFSDRKLADISYLERCQHRSVDAAILLGVRNDDKFLTEIEQSSELPFVLIDIPIKGKRASYVSSHNTKGAYKAVKYLIKLGHQDIVFINGHKYADVSKKRFNGYQKALTEAKIDYKEDFVLNGDYRREIAYQKMKDFLAENKEFTAVFAASDLMALGAMDAVKEAGFKIPQDISIIGFDGIDLGKHTTPALSTVKQKRFTMGQAAAEKLLKLINGSKDTEPILLDCELLIRDSVAEIKR